MQEFLQSFSKFLKSSFRQPPAMPAPVAISIQVKKIEQQYQQIVKLEPMTLKNIYALANKAFLLRDKDLIPQRDIKYLPWILYYGQSSRIVDNTEFCSFLLSLIQKRVNITLNSVVHSFLFNYDQKAPGNELIRVYIETNLSNYDEKSRRSKQWKERLYLFTKYGILMALQKIYTGSPQESLIQLGFTGELRSGRYLQEVVQAFFMSKEISFQIKLGGLRPLLEMENNPGILHFLELVPDTATILLNTAGVGADQKVQDILRPFYLKHLGDPRVAGNRTRWASVSQEGQSVFKQWISKLDLEMFFNVVERTAKDRAWRYRRKFWEAYLPYVENTWVALGNSARNVLWQSADREVAEGRKYAALKGANSEQSVFMLEMRGYVFVEWSHSGKLRIWEKKNCPLEFGQAEYSGQVIRSNSTYELTHHSSEAYGWQASLDNWIQKECGVKPAQSYYLR